MNRNSTAKPTFIQSVGSWTNDNAHIIARVPGAFSLFRILYNRLYPLNASAVAFGATVPAGSGPDLTKILVVSPQSWDASRVPWQPATGNYFYDIWQSANERYGAQRVALHQIKPADSNWLASLLESIAAEKPSHIIFQGEEDPNDDRGAYTQFAETLATVWNGQLIFVMYDSVYWWHIFKAEQVAQLYPHTYVHAIDRSPRELRKVVAKSGPGVLPTSQATIDTLFTSPEWGTVDMDGTELTMVGSMYPDREKKVASFFKRGIDLSVNPHRRGTTDRPSYVKYASAIGQSWGTINLSRNHGMPAKHVKTRVLEAPLFGTVLFSDEATMSSTMIPRDAFVYFRNARDLAKKVSYYRSHPEEFAEIRSRGHQRALEIANSIFWSEIERGGSIRP